MKILVAIAPVFNRGVIVPSGQKFSCEDALADSYIEAKTAKLYTEKAVESVPVNDPPNDETDERKKLLALRKEDLQKLAEETKIENLAALKTKEDIADAILLVTGEQQ